MTIFPFCSIVAALMVLLNLLVLVTMWQQTQVSLVEIYVANLTMVDQGPAFITVLLFTFPFADQISLLFYYSDTDGAPELAGTGHHVAADSGLESCGDLRR